MKNILNKILLIAIITFSISLILSAILGENVNMPFVILFALSIIVIIILGPVYLIKYIYSLFKTGQIYEFVTRQNVRQGWAYMLLYIIIIIFIANTSSPAENPIDVKIFVFCILTIPFLIPLIFYTLNWKKLKKDKKLEDDLIVNQQREKINLNQDKRYKYFICLSLAGGVITLFLRNSLIGFFIGLGSVGLAIQIFVNSFERWSRKESYNIYMLIGSFLLIIILLALIAALYMPQLEDFYKGEI